MKHHLEVTFTVHIGDTGDLITVTEDADGLDMVQLTYRDHTGKSLADIRFDREEGLPVILEALEQYNRFRKER